MQLENYESKCYSKDHRVRAGCSHGTVVAVNMAVSTLPSALILISIVNLIGFRIT